MTEQILEVPELSGPESLEVMIRNSAGVPTNKLIVSDIIKITNEIPQNVNQLNASVADYLSGRFLVGINLCGELASFSSGHCLKMLSNKKKEFSIAYHVRSAQNKCKTVKDKEMYAYMDSLYIEADNKYIEAIMFEKMIDEKIEVLKKAHYLMRKLADKDQSLGYKESNNKNVELGEIDLSDNRSLFKNKHNSVESDLDWNSSYLE